MRNLLNLFKKGNLIDKIFIILTPLIIVLGIYEFATVQPSNVSTGSVIDSSNNQAETKEEAEAKAKEEAEAKAKEEAEAKAKEEAEAKAKEEAEAKAKEEAEAKAKEEAEVKAKEEAEAKAKEEAEAKQDNTITSEIIRENIVGTSCKDFREISTSKPGKVTNDVTGNWRLSKINTSDDIIEYVKSYYENNFNDDSEIHAIINFTLNTTTNVSVLFDNILSVTIHEYVNKEELDAKKLFSGMVLGEYWIYLDNGDIEKIY